MKTHMQRNQLGYTWCDRKIGSTSESAYASYTRAANVTSIEDDVTCVKCQAAHYNACRTTAPKTHGTVPCDRQHVGAHKAHTSEAGRRAAQALEV